MVAVDGSALVALLDRDHPLHGRCVKALEALKEPLVTTWPAVSAAFEQIGESPAGREALVAFLQRGAVRVAELIAAEAARALELAVPLGLGCASVIALCEGQRVTKVLTALPEKLKPNRALKTGGLRVVP